MGGVGRGSVHCKLHFSRRRYDPSSLAATKKRKVRDTSEDAIRGQFRRKKRAEADVLVSISFSQM